MPGLVGFTSGYSFVLWLVFAGTFVTFAFYRLQYLDFYGTFCSEVPKSKFNHAAPGECFYFLQQPYKAGIITHLVFVLPSAILSTLQFTPAIRQQYTEFHRLNGYVILAMSIISTFAVFVVVPVSFGGGSGVILSISALAISHLWALYKAYFNIRLGRIHEHRAWMIRAWFWAGTIITQRIIQIVTLKAFNPNPQHYPMPCDKINSILGDRTLSLYPVCESFYTGESPYQRALVRADLKHPKSAAEAAAGLDSVFAFATTLAFLIHLIGVEIYIPNGSADSHILIGSARPVGRAQGLLIPVLIPEGEDGD
ncbi:hypothetical protein ANO14919_039140 [Xylariales sp. No.14919]|nr:hypothetical protein ANO14919_039140 [Xylariales sp. No.14919]